MHFWKVAKWYFSKFSLYYYNVQAWSVNSDHAHIQVYNIKTSINDSLFFEWINNGSVVVFFLSFFFFLNGSVVKKGIK